MAIPYLSGGGFSFQTNSVGGIWSWTVATNNVVGASQSYTIRDVVSPFGPLNQVQSPIPSDVISAMNDSLNSFKTQLQPSLAVVSGSNIPITISEGDSPSSSPSTTVANYGALGSFMNVSAVQTVPWLTPRPGSLIGIGQGQTATLSTLVNSGLLIAQNSPYTGEVVLTDNAVVPHTSTVTYVVTVLPRPTMSLSFNSLVFEYSLTTGNVTSPVNVTVTNSGPPTSILNFYVTRARNYGWTKFNPANAGPLNCGEFVQVEVGIETSSVPRAFGTYTETLVFNSQNATNNPVVLNVTLQVVQ